MSWVTDDDKSLNEFKKKFEIRKQNIEIMKKAVKVFEGDREHIIHGDVFQAVVNTLLTEIGQLYELTSAYATMIRSHEINLQAVNVVMPTLIKSKKQVEKFEKFKEEYEETTLKPLRGVIEKMKNQTDREPDFYG